jgi:hypothetical protein
MNRLSSMFLVLALLSGCANQTSTDNPVTEEATTGAVSAEPVESASAESSPTPDSEPKWSCDSEEDGLGASMTCQNSTKDDDGNTWMITFICSSDLTLKHGIFVADSNLNTILWDSTLSSEVQVRIDQEPIERWEIGTLSRGQAIAFPDLAGNGDVNDSGWEFLSRIQDASTFGVKGVDSNGYSVSAKFEVMDASSFALAFRDMGCARTNN